MRELPLVLSFVVFVLSGILKADVYTNVQEASWDGYVILYDISIPDDAGYRDATAVPYSVDNSATVGPYDRVAYYLELKQGPTTEWAYASMPAFDLDPTRLGLPHNVDNPVLRQQQVDDINIFSNKSGVTTGVGLSGGGLEMWPSDYVTTNEAGVPGASDATYDFGDGGASSSAGYGAFQIHNRTAGEVLLAWNRWGVAGGDDDDVGIGTNASGQPDYTLKSNADDYSVKRLQILVRPAVPIAAPAGITAKVPEAASYNLVYELDIGAQNDFSSAISYVTDNHLAHPEDTFGRVAYFMELDTEWVWVSMASFTGDAGLTGVPRTGGHFQQRVVSNMNVVASVGSGVTPVTGVQTGCIEFWNTDYDPGTSVRIPGGSSSSRDFNDSALGTGTYGSMQAHNYTTGETLFAFNNWNNGGVDSDLGIGNQGTGEPDWTGAANSGSHTSRKLYVLVEPRGDSATLTTVPKAAQLFPRDLMTDMADVVVSGTEFAGGFTDAVLRVYREGVQVGSDQVDSLAYTMGNAPFSLTAAITAELQNYEIELFLRDGTGSESFVKRVERLVAGDVYLIQGQSNADSALEPGSTTANGYVSPFVRTFGLNTEDSTGTVSNASWSTAQGDGSHEVPGGIGQWGLVMANKLATDNGIPIAVMNGADPGKSVDFFQRNDADPDDTTTNYGRLLHRMQASELDGAVRAIFYYQGEGDVDDGPVHEAGYLALRDDWLVDHPSTEHLYLFQVREGCFVTRFDVDLRNRQRLLADQFADLTVMSTNGNDGHVGCHYDFIGGYELMGTDITRMVQRDLYGGPDLSDTDPPNPALAKLVGSGDDTLRITLRNPADTVTFDAGAEADFSVEGAAVSVVSGSIAANGAIELQLSGSALTATAVTYTGHSGPGGPGPWVANANGIGLLSFSEPIVLGGPSITINQPSGNIASDVGTPVAISATATPDESPIALIEVLVGPSVVHSVSGAEVINTQWTPTVPGTYLVTVRATDDEGTVRNKSVHVFAGLPSTPQGVDSGLQIWLRSGLGMTIDGTGLISSWADQSGNGNDATQGTSGAMPTLELGEFGEEPGVCFGGDDFLGSATGMPTGSYTKVISFKLSDLAAYNQLLSSGVGATGAHSLTHFSTPYTRVYHNGLVVQSSQAIGAGDENIVIATYDAATNQAEMFINGVSTGIGTAVGDNTTVTYHLGAYNGDYFLDGCIGEALVYDRVLSAPERQAVEAYLGDRYPPVIDLVGDDPLVIECGQSYSESGATATDMVDGDLTGFVVIDAAGVNTAVPGSYGVTYNVIDAAGNAATEVTRTVDVVDTTPPVITLTGTNPQTIECGQAYSELGATAADISDGDLTGSIVIDATAVNTAMVGSYPVTYNVTDAATNTATEVTRTVDVVDTTPPVITLTGDAVVQVEGGSAYIDAGATATDSCDGNLTGSIVTGGLPVDTGTVGPAVVTYDVSDQAGNPAIQVTRTVNVVDTTPPVLTLNGDNPLILLVGDPFVDPGATASDAVDGDLTGQIVEGGDTVVTSGVGSFQRTYDVTDNSANSVQEQRAVLVVDLVPPIFQIQALGNPSNDARITFQSVLGLDYTIRTSTDLSNYSTLVTIPGDGTELSYDHVGGFNGPRRYYVIGVKKSGA